MSNDRPAHCAVRGKPKEFVMDKDRIAGSAKQIKGSVKEALGKAVGDAKLEAEGKAEQVEGKIQNAVGGLKDALRGK
jgi:uncharacterized protein YjbJ (UPF0337 family)